jgi:peptidoglycan/LPS O-acetylase OafA/YrhL
LSEIQYRADIDGLRALAVGAVVVFHAAPSLLPGGYLGVDIFLVISGYLITGIILAGLRAGSFTLAGFYLRRARRILPALLVVLGSVLALGVLILMPDELERLANSAVASALFIPNFAFLAELGYFDPAADSKPLLHLWSLGVEEQFYLAWPAILLLFARPARPDMTLGAIAALGAASLAAYVLVMRSSPDAAFFLPFTRFWELLIGATLAAAVVQTDVTPGAIRPLASNVVSCVGIVLMLCGIALTPRGAGNNSLVALVPTAGAAFFIAAGPSAVLNRTLFSWRPLVYVGLISYPLYLWHWPFLSFLRILHLEDVQLDRMLRLVVITLSVLAAMLTYHYVEIPARRRHDLGRVGVRLVAALAIVGVLGLLLAASGGLPQRTPIAADPFSWPMTLRIDERCFSRYMQPPEYRDDAFCVRNDFDRDPAIVLLGDSHANALWPGVVAAHRSESVLQIGGSACPFLRGTEFWRDERPVHRVLCPPLIEAAYGAITPATRVVILAARSVVYATPEKAMDFDPNSQPHFASPEFPGDAPIEIYEKALARDLARLVDANLDVVLVLQVPELGFSPRRCLRVRPLERWLAIESTAGCTIPRQDVEESQAGYRAAVARVVESLRSPRLRVMDPMDVLCDEQECRAIIDGVLMYRDQDHLSIEGSIFLWARLEARADPTLH